MLWNQKTVATRKPGEPKSRVRDNQPTLCPNPLDSLSYPLSLASVYNIALAHGNHSSKFLKNSAPLPKGEHLLGWRLPLPARRLRVGYVSIELRDRPVGESNGHDSVCN